METYKDYIRSLNKEELIQKLIGSEDFAPITRNEPKFSRVQILWGIRKVLKESKKEESFYATEEFVEKVIDKIVGAKWDKFYEYDYFRFDLKKPGARIGCSIIAFSFGCTIYVVFKILIWILT